MSLCIYQVRTMHTSFNICRIVFSYSNCILNILSRSVARDLYVATKKASKFVTDLNVIFNPVGDDLFSPFSTADIHSFPSMPASDSCKKKTKAKYDS